MQRVVVKKTLNHLIINKGHQCQNRSKQFLYYVKKKGGVGKNRVVKAIYLGFNFLQKRSELLIVAPRCYCDQY